MRSEGARQLADKGISTVKVRKVFARLFKRRHGSNAVERWSPVATGEILLSAFLFGKLAKRFAASLRAFSYFLCAYCLQRKSG